MSQDKPIRMNVLVGYECSGRIREAFRKRGHNAWSCDLQPAEDDSMYHIQCDIRDLLYQRLGTYQQVPREWNIAIFSPDCTYMAGSGLHWNTRIVGRQLKTDAALDEVRWLLSLPIPRIAIENPVGCIGSAIRPASQYIQPYEFGDDASKKTGLWLVNLPPLKPTCYIAPRIVNGKPRWANQTDSGQNRLGPSPTRAQDRARTYPGIADAMGEQWGAEIEERRNG